MYYQKFTNTADRYTEWRGFGMPVQMMPIGHSDNDNSGKDTLYAKSNGFNNSKGKAEEHFELFPHVHQPVRSVAPNGTIYERTGKTEALSPPFCWVSMFLIVMKSANKSPPELPRTLYYRAYPILGLLVSWINQSIFQLWALLNVRLSINPR